MTCRPAAALIAVLVLALPAIASSEQTGSSDARRALPREVSPQRADLGLAVQLTTLPSGEAALVVGEAVAGGPGNRAGIRAGDLVVGLDGPLPPYADDVDRVLDFERRFRAGDEILVEIDTDGSRRLVRLTAGTMSSERQERLLAWLRAAEKRLAAGLSLDCGSSVASGNPWVELALEAIRFPAAHLDIGRRPGGGFSFVAAPPALRVPPDLSVAELAPELRRKAEALGDDDILRIHFASESEEPPVVRLTTEVVAAAPTAGPVR